MNDQKQHFKDKLENYMCQCAFDEATKKTYIKKLLRDKEYSQKLLDVKTENVVIEIGVLREMLEKVK